MVFLSVAARGVSLMCWLMIFLFVRGVWSNMQHSILKQWPQMAMYKNKIAKVVKTLLKVLLNISNPNDNPVTFVDKIYFFFLKRMSEM